MKLKLDPVDRRILYELERNCRIPDSKLASMLKKSKTAVQSRIERMEKEDVISGYTVYVDMARLGNIGYKAYFRIKKTEEDRNTFCEYLKNRTDVIWVGTGDGMWDVGVTFFARNNGDFYIEKNRIFEKFGDIILSYNIGSLVSICSFGNKFLDNREQPDAKNRFVTPFGKPAELKLDNLDRTIIGYLLENGKMGVVELTKKCKSDMDTVRNRMKDLDEDQIVCAYVPNINLEKIGAVVYKTFVDFGGMTPELEDRFYRYCMTHPNITAFVRAISQWDVEIEVTAQNYEEYIVIINQIKKEFSNSLVSTNFMIVETSFHYPARKKMFLSK